ncbi:MAG: histidine--tRNA ligase [Hyphomicrobiaceae bacterium]
MAKKTKDKRPKARLPRGFRDVGASEIRRQNRMIATIAEVYEAYGFEPLETPAFEYTDALGKFLPDSDRPNEGVFSLQDEDEQWMSLRYDMTAPLARHVAENYQFLAKPYRRYTVGPVWRNEKPGPGRYRQFMQFDADTVGTSSVAADAEICMLMADTMERLGIARGDYIIRVNNRKILDGVLMRMGVDPASDDHAMRRLVILRALDKLDRLGIEGVRLLLGPGRKDESGDFTEGAGLADDVISTAITFLQSGQKTRASTLDGLSQLVADTDLGRDGVDELRLLDGLLAAAGFEESRVVIDPSVVRGLDYYTGPVFEAELTFEVKNDEGQTVRFGSVGGGGRYDDLVARFTGQLVPATGFSLGVSRLQAALQFVAPSDAEETLGPVVVLVMDKAEQARYQRMVHRLRDAGIRAEMYLGTSGMKAQMKYADKRGAPCVVIQGGDELAKQEVQIKDLIEGARLSEQITDSKEWREGRPAQFSVAEDALVEAIKDVLGRHERTA